MLGFAVKQTEMIIPQQKDRPKRMKGVKRSKQPLNTEEAPSLPRKLAMRRGDRRQPFGFAPPRLIAAAIRWGQAG